MFCARCGQPLSPGSRFCIQCGSPVTPEQESELRSAAGPAYAGFWERLAAYLIDSLLLGFLGFAIVEGLGISLANLPGQARPSPELGLLFDLIGILTGLLYFALMESSTTQATLGKMALGIVVTDLNGNRISLGKAVGRYFGKIVSTLICFVGFFMVGFTERRQALHDMMAGTLVVEKPGREHSPARTAVIIAGCVVFAVAGFSALVAAIAVPNFIRATAFGQLAGCESNLKNIATALEMYAADNSGSYPENMDKLVPKYLKFIPACPAANQESYVYTVTSRDQYGNPGSFEVMCQGAWHAKASIPPDYPRYLSDKGLQLHAPP